MNTPRIAVIVLTYRYTDLTLRCLASMAPSAQGLHLVLVDNDPTDADAERLKAGLQATGADWRYLPSPVNGGFSGGMNLGMRAALEAGFTHVALLNNDTVVAPDFGIRLREETERFPHDVLAGTVLDETTGLPSFNVGHLSRWTLEVRHDLSPVPKEPFDFVSGCFVVLPAEVLRRVGLFHEDYFMYSEDTELSLRLKRAGVRLRHRPSIIVKHRTGSSADRDQAPKQYYQIRNHARLVLERGTPLQRLVYGLRMSAALVNQLRRPKVFGTLFSALRDALAGRLGPRPSPGR